MVKKSFFGRMRHISVREIFQKSIREKYISLDFNIIFENYYNIIIVLSTMRASAQSVSAVRNRGL